MLTLFISASPHPNAAAPRLPEDAEVILNKSLKALGGEEKISKLHAVCVKGRCTIDGMLNFSFDGSFAAFDKARIELHPTISSPIRNSSAS